jgi:hypothetical protein
VKQKVASTEQANRPTHRPNQEARLMNTFTARFSDGTIATRTSRRPYSHAYLLRAVRPNGTTYQRVGFSKGKAQAQRNMESEHFWMKKSRYTFEITEVVAVAEGPADTRTSPPRRKNSNRRALYARTR